MPLGGFLDALPAMLFVGAHVLFLLVGVWAATAARKSGASFAPMLWLYAASQIVFLTFFAGAITMKMAVLVEQMLIVALIAALARNQRA